MPNLTWSQSLATGLEVMDRQHRDIFRELEDLAEAIGGQQPMAGIEARLAELCRHTIAHFQMEESLMKAHGYPRRIAHADRHHGLVLQVRELQYQFTRGRAHPADAGEFLGDWFKDHILSEDLAFARSLQVVEAV
jgi:hemerythrin